MKEILEGMILMFTCASCIQFWMWFINLDKTKQIKLENYMLKKELKNERRTKRDKGIKK